MTATCAIYVHKVWVSPTLMAIFLPFFFIPGTASCLCDLQYALKFALLFFFSFLFFLFSVFFSFALGDAINFPFFFAPKSIKALRVRPKTHAVLPGRVAAAKVLALLDGGATAHAWAAAACLSAHMGDGICSHL